MFTHSPDLSSEAIELKYKGSFKDLKGSIILPDAVDKNMNNL